MMPDTDKLIRITCKINVHTMAKKLITQALSGDVDSEAIIGGWIKTAREAGSKEKVWLFVEVNDGSDLENLQVLLPLQLITASGFSLKDFSHTGTCIQFRGRITKAPAKAKQRVEMRCEEILYVAACDSEYPFAKKKHSLEHLRDHLHLRSRTTVMTAVMRIRHELVQTTHSFFKNNHFYNVTTPILTLKDAETAGETFDVTCANKSLAAKLSVSGQLHAEYLALGFGRVYTIGPIFRAENSHTSRHLSEFWMSEVEMIFADLSETMDIIEDYVLTCAKSVFSACAEDCKHLTNHHESLPASSIMDVTAFPRITYNRALEIVNDGNKGVSAETLQYGEDLGSQHEQFLTKYHAGPVFVYDWPIETKPFYMRVNADENTCASVDLLVPDIGELVGGGQREERYDVLSRSLKKNSLSDEEYLSTRRWGSAPHSGFGVGFERLVMYFTGMKNIRDVIPFPRCAGSCVS